MLLVLLGAGCSTPAMKGSPFYDGGDVHYTAPAEDRVLFWPLFYKRDPVLSIAWPFFERNDDFKAIRPFYSAYGKQYNFLWPLAQFDLETHDNRIFPFFWGSGTRPADDYGVGFPLYWHFGHPLDDKTGGLDALFPLWCVDRHGTNQASVYCPWPLVRFMHEGRASGWHVFPLAGSYGDGNEYFRFQAAFLADQWGNQREDRFGSLMLPLYCYERTQQDWNFYSLPWSAGQTADSRWQFLLPALCYHRTNTESSLTLSPLWMQGASANPAEGGWAALLPLLYHSYGGQASTTLSPLWLSHTAANPQATSWQALLPVFYRGRNQESDLLISPVWSQGTRSNSNWQFLLPFYYARQDGADKFWATPLGGLHTGVDRRSWVIYPLLSGRSLRADGGEFWALAPFIHAAWNQTNAQSHVIPFYYYNSGTHTFLSPPWMRWSDATGTNAVVPPLLSWVSSDAESSDLYYALGLGKYSWGPRPGSKYLLPLFYHDPASQLMLSPVWAQWPSGRSGTTTVLPPLLSWKETQPQRSDFHLLLFMGKFSWGEKPGSQWLIPVFYHDRGDQTLLSPVWARWPSSGGGTNTCMPFTLSWMTREEQRNILWLLLGLGKFSWGQTPSSSYLIPLYYRDPQTHEFYTLIGGRKPDDFTYFATPLVGKREGDQAGSWVFPLYSHKRDVKTDDVDDWLLWGNHWERGGVSRSIFFPVFGYHNFGDRDALPEQIQHPEHRGKDFFCIPYCWYRNETTAYPDNQRPRARAVKAPKSPLASVREDKFEHGVFPLWSYASVAKPGQGVSNTDGSCLLWLYDYKRELAPLAKAPAGTNDYTRARVLWHLWHYERMNGDVSADLFPGFTYDRKTDGFKKISWLWRFFRYERDKDGGKKLDVLFIRLMRSEGGK